MSYNLNKFLFLATFLEGGGRDSLGFSMYAIMSTVNKEVFTAFFTLLHLPLLYSRPFSTILKSGVSGNPYLIPCFRTKHSILHH